MDIFLLLAGGVLAGNGLPTSSALRSRENEITGLFDLSEHIDSVPFSFKLGLCGRRAQIDVLVLQRGHRLYFILCHVLFGWIG